ncbi:hypothetical protein J437_LFUL009214 [Ladona fulva]|uniref:Tctex1 domain-containing protein 2 n=1 Tax=Ladona fulva TaxID=123851 RepID=A0A8K0NYI4_LADFU|nr:hypothetical protein J437_LFUL009214 [Ladona fulva]
MGDNPKENDSDSNSGTDEEGRDRTELPTGQFTMRPYIKDRFKSATVKDIIHSTLREELVGKIYSESEPAELTKVLAQKIKRKVMDLGFPRYKYVVQVILGEQIGAGIRTGSRCFWDADCDNYASDTYIGDSIFCMAAVFAIFVY